MLDTNALLGQIVPASEAAVVAYGLGVLDRTRSEAADATVRLGQRLINRLLRREPEADAEADPVRTAVVRLAETGTDSDMRALRLAELRIALRAALTDSRSLAEDLSAMLSEPTSSSVVHAEGERSVAVGGNVSGYVSTGDLTADAPRR
ncbi:hypothetical protein OHT52_04875 [Streptomyces sp. NBC_00247]|uniref:hypothetical protein n=1 Tax=Streptomyces sp. NBC_00247 TaxID=2975689 RepID=UPI002E2A2567|nr:hypothetical protein [Streptomyces sp. NBC_00247]